MRKLSTLVAVLALSALVVPASAAGWTEMTTSWNTQGVGVSWGLVADPVAGTLYAFNGTSAKVYDKGTDTWTALTSATNTAYSPGDNATQAVYVNGQIILRGHMRNYLSIYDIATDTWAEPAIGGGKTHNWAQGSVYNPVTGKFWAFFSEAGVGDWAVPYDIPTDTWGAVVAYTPVFEFEMSRQGVTLGTVNYRLSGQGTAARLQDIPFDWGADPNAPVTGNTLDFHTFESTLGDGGAWGVRQIGAHGTDIYVVSTGAGSTVEDDLGGLYGDGGTPPPPSGDGYTSVWGWVYAPGTPFDRGDGWCMVWSYQSYNDMAFAVYDTLTDTWTDLEMLNTGTSGTYRNGSLAAVDGVVYVQNNGQFFAYDIPEPATMALLGFGGIGLLIRRRRK